jgi:glutathione synthase/RimK-type ligase-like ATP-grasp enzyme
LRFDSPGRSAAINLAILARGHAAAQAEGSATVHSIDESLWRTGLFLAPRQWYLGFAVVLRSLNEKAAQRKLDVIAPAEDILLMFDKRACHEHLGHHGVPVPGALGIVDNFADLVERMRVERAPRVFIKSRHGSAASGVVALEVTRRGVQAWTTVEVCHCEGALSMYNTRRVRRLTAAGDIATLIDELCRHHVHVERWFPKAGLDGRRFDLRVLVIGGEPAHTAVRTSRSPMTNLHLGGERREVDAVRRRMGDEAWDRLIEGMRHAARAFPASFQVSFDVAIDPTFRRYAVLEANAFGDLLKGVTFNGQTTYETQARRLAAWRESR